MKKKQIHFVSSLPRSGSTLLCNILAQNPKFHSTPTSGCLEVLFSIGKGWDKVPEHKAAPNPKIKENVLEAILYAYFADVNKEIIFDKCRGWVAHIEFIEHILKQKVKILVNVRPIVDILSSMEKLWRETSKTKQPPVDEKDIFSMQTIEGRCDYWMRPDQLVGLMHNRINDAFNRGLGDRILLVPYEHLTKDPHNMLGKIYEFLDQPYYKHDFDNVEQITKEDDEVWGFTNLHKISNKVTYKPSDAMKILGPEVVKKYLKPVNVLNQ